jgi:3',5'-cyclic AMP phosphodiesterase CpdA
MAPRTDIRQIVIVHLSDIHFGSTHTFNPPTSAAGDVPPERNYPTLLEKLREDLDQPDPGVPVIIAITGDMAQTGSYAELSQAEDFIRGLTGAPLLGAIKDLRDVYLVPGNHDVLFDKEDMGERWQQWVELHNRLRETRVDRSEPWALDEVHDRVDEMGVIVATLNSATNVRKGKPAQDRGFVDQQQIATLQQRLEAIPPERRESAIRLALIHHHPVLLPALTEPGRGDDAVHNAARLLTVLRRFGFHMVLHGHKHNPYVFTEDAVSAYRKGQPHPIVIAAGGSVGSTELPTSPQCGNCYNQIVVKWDPDADHSRVRTVTRGLHQIDDEGNDLLPWDWYWGTLREDDRQFVGGTSVPRPTAMHERDHDPQQDAASDASRVAEYQQFNGYFPTMAVMPSLEPNQRNEARLWIVRHQPSDGTDPGPGIVRAAWSAGPRFPVVTVDAGDDPALCAVFHYYGPMLVHVQMEFVTGETQATTIYVRQPRAG